jgi:uncharacterized protein YukE
MTNAQQKTEQDPLVTQHQDLSQALTQITDELRSIGRELDELHFQRQEAEVDELLEPGAGDKLAQIKQAITQLSARETDLTRSRGLHEAAIAKLDQRLAALAPERKRAEQRAHQDQYDTLAPEASRMLGRLAAHYGRAKGLPPAAVDPDALLSLLRKGFSKFYDEGMAEGINQ